MVFSEVREYHGPLAGHNESRVFFLDRTRGDSLFALKDSVWQDLGCPTYIDVQFRPSKDQTDG